MRTLTYLYLCSLAPLACYDNGDQTEGQQEGQQEQQTSSGKTFTQDELNKILADDRRKHAAKLAAMETKLNETLGKTQLTQTERDELEASVEEMRSSSSKPRNNKHWPKSKRLRKPIKLESRNWKREPPRQRHCTQMSLLVARWLMLLLPTRHSVLNRSSPCCDPTRSLWMANLSSSFRTVMLRPTSQS